MGRKTFCGRMTFGACILGLVVGCICGYIGKYMPTDDGPIIAAFTGLFIVGTAGYVMWCLVTAYWKPKEE